MRTRFGRLAVTIVIVLFVIAAAGSALGDLNSGTHKYLDTLFDGLPFSDIIRDIVYKWWGIPYTIPPKTAASVLRDLLKLACMALIQAPVRAVLETVFLRIPAGLGDWQDRERYMDSLGYKFKSALLTVLSVPLLSIIASMILGYLGRLLANGIGNIGAMLVGMFGLIGAVGLSCIPLVAAGLTVGGAVLFRVLDTLLTKMASTMVAEAGCIIMYQSLLNGRLENFLMTALLLVILLAGLELLFNSLRIKIMPSLW